MLTWAPGPSLLGRTTGQGSRRPIPLCGNHRAAQRCWRRPGGCVRGWSRGPTSLAGARLGTEASCAGRWACGRRHAAVDSRQSWVRLGADLPGRQGASTARGHAGVFSRSGSGFRPGWERRSATPPAGTWSGVWWRRASSRGTDSASLGSCSVMRRGAKSCPELRSLGALEASEEAGVSLVQRGSGGVVRRTWR